MQKIILVTGASSGFGKAIAEKFASEKWNCIITGRRKEKIESLAASLHETYGVEVLPLVFDVQDKEAVFNHLGNLPTQWQGIDVVVNNAGLALGRDSFEMASLTDWETMIDTNVKGLLYLTKAVLPLMIPRKSGHIVNIGSIAGKEVYGNGNVYCATKSAVDALNKAMRIDLLPHAIKVTGIHPGMLETEFSLVRFKGNVEKAAAVYQGVEPLHPEDIASTILWVIQQPKHVVINDLVITPLAQANTTQTFRG